MKLLNNDWDDILSDFLNHPRFENFFKFILSEYEKYTLYPDKENIFAALKLTSFEKLKVVILGQDPYHQPGQANGLAFSVNKGVVLPPSLKNIYKELQSDLGIAPPKHGDLSKWAKQGVLLLNTSLTVRNSQPNFYSNSFWKNFTDYIIKKISENKKQVVYILWGNNAQQKIKIINTHDNLIIKSAHPSPLSANRGFFGSRPFSKTNEYLKENRLDVIDWSLND